MADIWIVATSPEIDVLLELVEPRPGARRVVAVGTGIPDADVAIACPEGLPIEALAPAVASAVPAQPGDAVLFASGAAERSLAGALAARLDAALLTGVRACTTTGFVRERHGGIVLETVESDAVIVAIVPDAPPAGQAPVIAARPEGCTAHGVDLHDARVVQEVSSPHAGMPLRDARRIVAAGRGFRTEADLALARQLTAALGAELACTRPLADGLGWLASDRCVGISRARVAPEMYVAVGVSGQLHHLAGARGSATIVAVNADPDAPVFGQCDYGIVADLYDVVPRLVQELGTP